MTKEEQLVELYLSWVDGECPGEIVLDFLNSEMGIDVDNPVRDMPVLASFRWHMTAFCHRNYGMRLSCEMHFAIERMTHQAFDIRGSRMAGLPNGRIPDGFYFLNKRP